MAYPEQPSYVRIGSSWKTVEQAFVYKSGAWKRINQAYIRQAGAWKRVYAYDAIAPTIVRFELSGTVSGGTYGATKTTASYILEFSETIASWNNSMVTFSSNPGTAWSISSITTPDNKTYAINISMGGTQTSGDVRLSVLPTGVTDESGINPWTGSATVSQTFSIDVTKPTVAEFASVSAATAFTVVFTLRFSEVVTGLLSSEFTIGGTSTGWVLSSFTGSGTSYSITLTESSANSTTSGTLTLSIPTDCVSDAIGNLGPASTATSTTFNVARTPVTPSISAISSSDLTLHNRRINYTASVPAGFTTISHVIAYLYDANDNYTGTSQTIDVTDSSAAFTADGSFNVGRNPGTKYFVRTQTLNTLSLSSPLSTRSEVTTGADRTPPTLAAPSVTANVPSDPGWPGAAVVRSLSYSFATPSTYLTSEVAKVTVYCIRSSDGVSMGSVEHLKGAAWGAGALTGTFGSLAGGTNYYIYATSTDEYGGTNSTANSGSTTLATLSTYGGVDSYLFYDWGAEANYTAETGTFEVTGNSFTQTSIYSLPGTSDNSGTQYKITSVRVEAWVVISGIYIASSSRSFHVDFSGTDTSASTSGGTVAGNQSPWSTSSGTATQDKTMAWTLAYGNPGAGRIRVRGAGSIGTVQVTPTDQRIRVKVYITGKQKTWTLYSATRNYTY